MLSRCFCYIYRHPTLHPEKTHQSDWHSITNRHDSAPAFDSQAFCRLFWYYNSPCSWCWLVLYIYPLSSLLHLNPPPFQLELTTCPSSFSPKYWLSEAFLLISILCNILDKILLPFNSLVFESLQKSWVLALPLNTANSFFNFFFYLSWIFFSIRNSVFFLYFIA